MSTSTITDDQLRALARTLRDSGGEVGAKSLANAVLRRLGDVTQDGTPRHWEVTWTETKTFVTELVLPEDAGSWVDSDQQAEDLLMAANGVSVGVKHVHEQEIDHTTTFVSAEPVL